jgi:uncharacterized membrane protein
MSSRTGPVLFEAICTPSRSLGRRGMVALSIALLSGAAATGGLFLALGAWPVLGFAAIEALLVLFLVSLHRRWARRSMEVLLLTEGSLIIRRTDVRGQQREFSLDPYWTRLRLEERPGRVSLLVLERRGQAIEVGQLLGESQKRELAEMLGAALRRWREPIFDNPQLRNGG